MAKDGEDVPALKNRPLPTMYQRQFWEAFHSLSSSRRFHSAGIAAIPISEIEAYLRIYGIADLNVRHLYVVHIQALDDKYTTHYAKKS